MSAAILIHLIGTTLFAAAFYMLGRGIVQRENSRSFSPLPAFGLVLAALAFQLIVPTGGIIARFGHLFLDFGLGMGLASFYLMAQRTKPALFLVPSLLALVISGGIYGVDYLNKWVSGDIRDRADAVEFLVELGPDDQLSEIQPLLDAYDAVAEKAFPNVDLSESEDLAQYFLVHVAEKNYETLAELLKDDRENVDQLARNGVVELIQPTKPAQTVQRGGQFLADDPFLSKQWYAEALQYNQVYQFLQKNKPVRKVKVAIVDTGVDGVHEDIEGVYTKSGGIGDRDKHSHGTHCAGLAGAATNNGKGVGSLNLNGDFITLSGYPALDERGRGTDQRVAQAIIDAAESGADVISMSLGGPAFFGPPKAQKDAINYARKLGAIVVVAAGNSNDDARRYSPANIPGVITVSAVDPELNKAAFSNVNTRLKMPIAAPGVDILSSIPGSDYQSYNGTSMATPIVAGLVGMLCAYNPDLTAEEAYRILNQTGTQVRDSDKVGRVINPLAALQAVAK